MPDNRRVLVIDDSETVCRMVDMLLRKCGFEHIDVVHDGVAALERMSGTSFDLVLCDWEMEPMTGLDVLHQVRRSPMSRNTPFILMSAKKEPHWVLQATQSGADCLLVKPFDVGTLKAKISQVAAARERV